MTEERPQKGLLSIQIFPGPLGYAFLRFRRALCVRFVCELFENLALLARQGLPLAEGIRRMIPSRRRSSLRYVLRTLAEDLERGLSVADAIAARSSFVLPKVSVAALRSGESAGCLPEVLEAIAADLRGSMNTRRELRRMFLVPLILVLLTVPLIAILRNLVFPRYVAFWDSASAKLPPSTLWAYSQGNPAVLLLLLFGGAWLLLYIGALRWERGHAELISWLPGFGSAYRQLAQARVLRMAGILLGVGIPADEALKEAGEVFGSNEVRERTKEAVHEIRAGEAISSALANHSAFDLRALWHIRAGERNENLPERLRHFADLEQERIRESLQKIFQVFRVVTVLGIALVEGLFVVGGYEPLFRIVEVIKEGV